MEYRKFELVSKYKPTGDQPEAINSLVEGINDGLSAQVLKGVTGSGKTFTMANVIAQVNRPTLVLAHNKTLAAQLCNEFREFFPNNRVEFFVSYYDYYQPEAYIVSTDTYIEKDMSVNDEIDKLRHSATSSLLERSDTIVVASVSCIYGLGAPKEYYDLHISLRIGDKMTREDLIHRLINIQYTRNEIDFTRSTFRARGDVVDIFPADSSEHAIRVEFFDDEIEDISEFEVVTGKVIDRLKHASIFPASHYAVGSEKLNTALEQIRKDAKEREEFFTREGKYIEAQRIKERTNYDIEMMQEMGYCSGIENYSRYFDGRSPGEPPYTLLDYFPNGFLLFVDESHITLPQVRGMYNGDRARKTSLVEYGFRLPSAYDNRPLNFEEFNSRIGQTIYVSATPNEYELSLAGQVVEQVIRPTYLLDPEVEVRPSNGQVDNLYDEIKKNVEKHGKVLVTTLTKKMAEDLCAYFGENGIRVKYLHSDIDTLERVKIINELRADEFDCLIGINLLREGLDLPEVTLVAILDADKEGFLRSATSLIQIIGRAARNSESKVIMYADMMTDSMKQAIQETERRRKIQMEYNKKHNVKPMTIKKDIVDTLKIRMDKEETKMTKQEISKKIEQLKGMMNTAASQLDFETAINLREEIAKLKRKLR
ncbi:MAG TPA: excinuclease ABC subunit UvrB [Candidatus Onthoplasma faecigallinarum]|nr:excinuclease ABC subunit UvrB [Candidatus Onthoplasma faecigallinarum]